MAYLVLSFLFLFKIVTTLLTFCRAVLIILLFGEVTVKEKEGLVKESEKKGLRNEIPAIRTCATEARWIFLRMKLWSQV